MDNLILAINYTFFDHFAGMANHPRGCFATPDSGTVKPQVLRELAYNVADIANNSGFGLLSVMAAKSMSSLKGRPSTMMD